MVGTYYSICCFTVSVSVCVALCPPVSASRSLSSSFRCLSSSLSLFPYLCALLSVLFSSSLPLFPCLCAFVSVSFSLFLRLCPLSLSLNVFLLVLIPAHLCLSLNLGTSKRFRTHVRRIVFCHTLVELSSYTSSPSSCHDRAHQKRTTSSRGNCPSAIAHAVCGMVRRQSNKENSNNIVN